MTYQIVYLYNEPVNMFHIWWDCEMCKVVQETLNDGFKTFYYCISQKKRSSRKKFCFVFGQFETGRSERVHGFTNLSPICSSVKKC